MIKRSHRLSRQRRAWLSKARIYGKCSRIDTTGDGQRHLEPVLANLLTVASRMSKGGWRYGAGRPLRSAFQRITGSDEQLCRATPAASWYLPTVRKPRHIELHRCHPNAPSAWSGRLVHRQALPTCDLPSPYIAAYSHAPRPLCRTTNGQP